MPTTTGTDFPLLQEPRARTHISQDRASAEPLPPPKEADPALSFALFTNVLENEIFGSSPHARRLLVLSACPWPESTPEYYPATSVQDRQRKSGDVLKADGGHKNYTYEADWKGDDEQQCR